MAKGTLDQTGGSVAVLCLFEELGRREEDTFSFRRRRPASDVHFQPKSAKVVEDEVHAPLEVFSRPKWKCTIVNVETLEDLVCGECFRREHRRCVAADFPFDHVVVTGSHDFEDGDGLLAPYDFQCFGESRHEEKEEDRSHVVTLAHTNCLWYFNSFFFDFEDAYVVGVEGSNR